MLSTLSTQIGDLQKQIDTLRATQYKLRHERFALYQNKVASEVGKCFRDLNGEYFKIVGVPREENEFQFPCFFLSNEPECPFYFDSIYYNVEEPTKYERISLEEFNEEMENQFMKLKERIK